MKLQLRTYTINRGKLDEFAALWKKSVVPLRIKAGFQVGGAWLNRETNQFVWILTYDGPKDWESANNEYYALPERKALDPDPASMIARMETHMVESVS